MIVTFIAIVVCLGILWASGVFGDMLVWLFTKAIPWLFFPVVFFLALFWITDQLSSGANLVVSFALALLYCAGGVLQLVMTFYYTDGLLTVRRVTRWDTYTHWSIKPRIRIFALVGIIVGGMGVWNPYPLHRIFMAHQAGLPWLAIVDRAISDGNDAGTSAQILTPRAVSPTKAPSPSRKERNPLI